MSLLHVWVALPLILAVAAGVAAIFIANSHKSTEANDESD
jgi:hypothetical protein